VQGGDFTSSLRIPLTADADADARGLPSDLIAEIQNLPGFEHVPEKR
jgi:hypothetical protein